MSYWKGKIEPTVSDAIVSHVDLFSSLAKLAGSETRVHDSQEFLEVLMGTSQQGREELILEATSRTALRKGDWVMIPPYKGPAVQTQVNIELGNSKEFQLYNLKEDIGQQNNLAKSEPEKLQEMIKIFEHIRGTKFQEIEQLELK
jgi:arylsulfatase A-like enzyme